MLLSLSRVSGTIFSSRLPMAFSVLGMFGPHRPKRGGLLIILQSNNISEIASIGYKAKQTFDCRKWRCTQNVSYVKAKISLGTCRALESENLCSDEEVTMSIIATERWKSRSIDV
nr:hypothetical protein [uncultured organism]